MPEQELVIAITGHRPGDLMRAGVRLDPAPAIAEFLARAAARAKALGVARVHVITGGALGIDQLVAGAVADNPLVAGVAFGYSVYLPFPLEVISARWRAADRERLARLIAGALSVRIVSPVFDWGAYQKRNELMVDDASLTIAFWTGKAQGGTYNCVRYAVMRAHKPTYNALDGFRPISADSVPRPAQRSVRNG